MEVITSDVPLGYEVRYKGSDGGIYSGTMVGAGRGCIFVREAPKSGRVWLVKNDKIIDWYQVVTNRNVDKVYGRSNWHKGEVGRIVEVPL